MEQSDDATQTNAEIMARYASNLSIIRDAHLKTQVGETQMDIYKAPPLSLKEGGSTQAFNFDILVEALTAQARLEKSLGRPSVKMLLNLFDIDMTQLAVPNVPVSQAHVDELKHHYFKSPSAMPFHVRVALTSLTSLSDVKEDLAKALSPKKSKAKQAWQGWRHFSPDEFLMAIVERIAEDISGHGAKSSVLQSWCAVIRNVEVEFVLFETGSELDILRAGLVISVCVIMFCLRALFVQSRRAVTRRYQEEPDDFVTDSSSASV